MTLRVGQLVEFGQRLYSKNGTDRTHLRGKRGHITKYVGYAANSDGYKDDWYCVSITGNISVARVCLKPIDDDISNISFEEMMDEVKRGDNVIEDTV